MSSYDLIYAAVRTIPRGKVSTYGAVARMAGLPRQARLVGYALHALPAGTTVPWQRVVNAQGRIALRQAGSSAATTQLLRLEREGVRVNAAGRISLATYGWRVKEETPAVRPTRVSGKSRSGPAPTTAR